MERPGIAPDATQGDRTAEFEQLTRELAERELELASLEKELSIFEERYARTVGVLFAKLDGLDKEIARELLRLNPKEEYRQGFQRAEQKAKASQEAVDEKTAHGDKQPFTPSDELKDLFRKVAKTIHPDLATDQQERDYRNSLMARANEAYKNGDMDALQRIIDEWEHRDQTPFTAAAASGPFDQLEQKIHQVRLRILEIEAKIAQLKASDLYQLMTRVRQAEQEGRDLLADMARNVQEQIVAARKLLDSLRERQ